MIILTNWIGTLCKQGNVKAINVLRAVSAAFYNNIISNIETASACIENSSATDISWVNAPGTHFILYYFLFLLFVLLLLFLLLLLWLINLNSELWCQSSKLLFWRISWLLPCSYVHNVTPYLLLFYYSLSLLIIKIII